MSSRCKNALLISCVNLIFILRHAYLEVTLSVSIRQEPLGFLLVNKRIFVRSTCITYYVYK